MPDIELRYGAADPYWLLAVMSFPLHEQARQTDYAINWLSNDLASFPENIPLKIDRRALSLVVAAAKSNGTDRATANAFKRGSIAGDYLLALYFMHRFSEHFKVPSVSKAIHLVSHYCQTTEYGDGTKPPRSASEIRECFHEFNSVAHLHGAYRLLIDVPNRKNPGIFASEQWVCDFLGVAGELQDFGLSFKPPAPKEQGSLLNEGDLWRVPDSIGRRALSLREPPSWMLRSIKKYKAKKRG